MEILQIVLLIGILLVYPLFPGSALLGMLKKKKEECSLGSVFVAGVLLCGLLFGVFAFGGVRLCWTLDVFSKAALMLALLLLAVSVIICIAVRSCRKVLSSVGSALKKRPGREEVLISGAFLLVAAVYLLQPFSLEPGHDTAERVVTYVETGKLVGVDALTGSEVPVEGNWKQQLENLPVFYACLCVWSGLSAADVLFSVIPYVVLFLAFCVFSELAAAVFEKNQKSRAMALVLLAMITVCGNTAYMNTSYGLLHYPYEAMTIFSSILLPLVFLYALSKEHVVLLLFLCVNAVFCAGAEKAVWMIALQAVCYVAALCLSRFLERRSDAWM